MHYYWLFSRDNFPRPWRGTDDVVATFLYGVDAGSCASHFIPGNVVAWKCFDTKMYYFLLCFKSISHFHIEWRYTYWHLSVNSDQVAINSTCNSCIGTRSSLSPKAVKLPPEKQPHTQWSNAEPDQPVHEHSPSGCPRPVSSNIALSRWSESRSFESRFSGPVSMICTYI